MSSLVLLGQWLPELLGLYSASAIKLFSSGMVSVHL